MSGLEDLSLFGVAISALIVLIINWLKERGMPGRLAPYVALGLGLLLAGVAGAVDVWPEIAPIVRLVLSGLLIGLGAVGTHSTVKRLREGQS